MDLFEDVLKCILNGFGNTTRNCIGNTALDAGRDGFLDFATETISFLLGGKGFLLLLDGEFLALFSCLSALFGSSLAFSFSGGASFFASLLFSFLLLFFGFLFGLFGFGGGAFLFLGFLLSLFFGGTLLFMMLDDFFVRRFIIDSFVIFATERAYSSWLYFAGRSR